MYIRQLLRVVRRIIGNYLTNVVLSKMIYLQMPLKLQLMMK